MLQSYKNSTSALQIHTFPKINIVSSHLTALDGFFLPDCFFKFISTSSIHNLQQQGLPQLNYVIPKNHLLLFDQNLPPADCSLDACPRSYIGGDKQHSFLNHLFTPFFFFHYFIFLNTPPSYSLFPPRSLFQPEES